MKRMTFASMTALRAALMNLAEKPPGRALIYGCKGWYQDVCYNSMESAKESLAKAKDALNEDFYDVAEINSVTLLGIRESNYSGERFAPIKQEKKWFIISRSDNSLMRINNTSPGTHLLWSLLVLIILILINKCS